jgi:hypothetical protein
MWDGLPPGKISDCRASSAGARGGSVRRGAAFACADGVLAGASGRRFSSAGGRGEAGGVGLACGAGAGGLGGGKISL